MKDEPSPPPAPAAPNPSDQILAQAKATPSYYGPAGSRVYSGDPNVAGSFRMDETLSPEQQKLYSGRTAIADALLGRSGTALKNLPVGFEFNGATDPTSNKFFENQRQLLDRAFDRDETALTQKLANQGIPMGSEAYDREVENFRRSKDDALSRASTDALTAGYSQAIGTRQQNLNEVAQALGGSQLTPVGSAGQPVDTASAYANQQAGLNRQYQGDLAGYNAGVASNNSTMGGLFSLGAAALPKIISLSDRRLKRDIERVGELLPGVGWYSFHYLWDKPETPKHNGVMADELARVMPEAVLYDSDGFAMVDYGALFAGRTVH